MSDIPTQTRVNFQVAVVSLDGRRLILTRGMTLDNASLFRDWLAKFYQQVRFRVEREPGQPAGA